MISVDIPMHARAWGHGAFGVLHVDLGLGFRTDFIALALEFSAPFLQTMLSQRGSVLLGGMRLPRV